MKKLIIIICFSLIPITIQAATQTQNQIYVLCKASLRYVADLELTTGAGPKWRTYMDAMRAYSIRIDGQYADAWEHVLWQMNSGQMKTSDIAGTASNCLRWYEDDEIGDL